MTPRVPGLTDEQALRLEVMLGVLEFFEYPENAYYDPTAQIKQTTHQLIEYVKTGR